MAGPKDIERKTLRTLNHTYLVALLMFGVTAMQVFLLLEMTNFFDEKEPDPWEDEDLVHPFTKTMVFFFISYISLQFLVFFHRALSKKHLSIIIIFTIWTCEWNSISIMKVAKHTSHRNVVLSFFFVVIMIAFGVLLFYFMRGFRPCKHISRRNIIRFSQQLFILDNLGILCGPQLRRPELRVTIFIILTVLTNLYVIFFGLSLNQPDFFNLDGQVEFLLIGHLYFLVCFALAFCYSWTGGELKHLIVYNTFRKVN